jgi:hypothetical protein
MGRTPEGPRVRWKRGWAYSHFTWSGHPYRIAILTRDKREAEEASAREYTKVVTGEARPVRREPGKLHDLADLLDMWIESKRPSLDPKTVPTLDIYARRFVDFFGTLGGIDKASGSTYGLARLGQGLRTTVLRELAYLRQFLDWCVLHGALASAPTIPKLPPKARGTRTGPQRAKAVHISPADADAILAALPEESKTIAGRKWPIRARFAFMWETMLRPETLSRLRVPEHWRPGSSQVELEDEDDKARWGRTLDLSPEAVRLLRQVAPAEGLIFGDHNYSKVLKRVATAILGPRLGRMFAPYDFRHGGAKDALDAGAGIRGVAFNLGHKRISTTDKYLAPDRAAGAEATRIRAKRTQINAPKAHPTKKRPRKR